MANKSRKTSAPSATDDTIALYAHLLLRKQSAVKSEQKRLSALVKEAGQHGVVWSDVKGALKEYEQSPEARRAKAERMAAIFQAIGAPVQLELFDAYQPRREDDEAVARHKGRLAAVCHGDCVPPYPAGSAEGQAWLDGWHSVQKLVDAYNSRFNDPAHGEVWDEKPVASVKDISGVDYDPDKVAAATAEAVTTDAA